MHRHHAPPPHTDRRWPAPATTHALTVKYGATTADQVITALSSEYYDRAAILRFRVRVGRDERLTPASQPRWVEHGALGVGHPVRVLGFELFDPPSRGLRAVIAVHSPLTSELLLMRLPLGEIELPAVRPGERRAPRDWRTDPAYEGLENDPHQGS